MNISTKVHGNAMLLSLSGDLIGENHGAQILEHVNNAVNKDIIKLAIDLQGVRYLNSSGLGVLITVHTKLKQKQGTVVLINPGEQIVKLLTITKLDNIFSVVNSETEALEKLK